MSSWHGIKWNLLGLVLFLAGITWLIVAQRNFRFWLLADKYVNAELEVTRFHPKPRDSHARCQIEGIIHPGGKNVVTSDRDMSINVRDGPDDRWGHEPTPDEIEGKLLPVSYWPSAAAEESWWHPPNVAGRNVFRSTGVIVRDLFISVGLLYLASFAFTRGARILKRSAADRS